MTELQIPVIQYFRHDVKFGPDLCFQSCECRCVQWQKHQFNTGSIGRASRAGCKLGPDITGRSQNSHTEWNYELRILMRSVLFQLVSIWKWSVYKFPYRANWEGNASFLGLPAVGIFGTRMVSPSLYCQCLAAASFDDSLNTSFAFWREKTNWTREPLWIEGLRKVPQNHQVIVEVVGTHSFSNELWQQKYLFFFYSLHTVKVAFVMFYWPASVIKEKWIGGNKISV